MKEHRGLACVFTAILCGITACTKAPPIAVSTPLNATTATVAKVALTPDDLANVAVLVPEGEPESVLGVRWENGEPRFDYAPQPTAEVASIAWAPDGLRLALGDSAGRVHIRNAETGTEVRLVAACSTRVRAVEFSPDGNTWLRAATPNWTRTRSVYGMATPELLCRNGFGHEEGVISLSFSADGKVLASGRQFDSVRFWDTSSGVQLGQCGYHEQVSISPHGNLLAIWGMGGSSISILDATTQREVVQLPGHDLFVTAVAFSPDGKSLASVGTTDCVRHWDTESGKALNPLWNAEQRSALSRLTTPSGVYKSLAFSPDGKAVALTLGDAVIRVVDSESAVPRLTITGHSRLITVIKWSPDGKRIASLSDDKTVRIWDSATGTELMCFHGYSSGAHVVAWSPDAQSLAVGGDRALRLWSRKLDQSPVSFGPRTSLTELGWSDDGKQLVSHDDSRSAQYWDTSSGTELAQSAVGTFHDYEARARSGFDGHDRSPDSKTFATVDAYGKSVVLWDSVTNQTRLTLAGGEQSVNSVAWSTDSRLIAAGSDDGAVRIWDAHSGKKIQQLDAHFPRLNGTALDWSNNGTLVAAGDDQAVRFWRFKGEALDLDAVLWANENGWVIWRANAPPARRVLRGETGSLIRVTGPGGALGSVLPSIGQTPLLSATAVVVTPATTQKMGELLVTVTNAKKSTVAIWIKLEGPAAPDQVARNLVFRFPPTQLRLAPGASLALPVGYVLHGTPVLNPVQVALSLHQAHDGGTGVNVPVNLTFR